MPTVFVEVDPPADDEPAFTGDTADLVYFLSWAYASRFGASHELARLAQALRQDHGIDLRPLQTFADRDIEEDVDREALERAWQDGGPVASCCRAIVRALDADQALRELTVDHPSLRGRLQDLGAIAGEAARRGSRIRITYSMGEGE